MNRHARNLLVASLLLLAACRSSTPLGPCIGLNGNERAGLRYEYSARNIVVGIVFFGLVIPPVMVGLNQLRCPVEQMPAPPRSLDVRP